MNPLLAVDGYKLYHYQMMPENTILVESNLTPRSTKYAPEGCDQILVFGNQMVVRELHNMFQEHFFSKKKDTLLKELKYEYDLFSQSDFNVDHFGELHDLGYLPVLIKSMPEGSFVNPGVPVFTIRNTHPKFAWVTNFLETTISMLSWKPMTSATIAYSFKVALNKWVDETDETNSFHRDFGFHDFSARGLDSLFATMSSGLGHLVSIKGTDSIPSLYAARKYYDEKGMVATSIPATEHSIQCAYYNGVDEKNYLNTILDRFPTGPVGTVSDGFDLWKLLTEDLASLKDKVKARTGGPLVIRPDSGDPVDIITGINSRVIPWNLGYFTSPIELKVGDVVEYGEVYYKSLKAQALLSSDMLEDIRYFDIVDKDAPEMLGVIEILWNIFGGTINSQGYKVLDPCIRMIYGDSINMDRFNRTNTRLKKKGFASTNWVAGIGSFTYQFNTRDTFGFAIKSTYQESLVDGKVLGKDLYKDPLTDDGTKKSARGRLLVENQVHGFEPDEVTFTKDDNFVLIDGVSREQEQGGCLQMIYMNGDYFNQVTLTEIRERVNTKLL